MTPSSRFRLFLVCCTLATLALLARLSQHVSFYNQVFGRYSIAYFALLLAVGAASAGTILFHHPYFYRRIHRFRYSALVSIASMVMLVGAAEMAVRTFDPFGISHIEESARLWFAYVPDPVLVFRLRAHDSGTYQGVNISTNALGFRDRELEHKRRDEVRILLLGDSITFGYGVPDDQTYGRKLESILTSELGRRVRTVNGGMGGYNTVQEYAFLQHEASEINPDVVSLLYLPNDINTNSPPFDPRIAVYGNASKMRRVLLEKSWLFRLAVFASTGSEMSTLAQEGTRAPGVADSLNALANMAVLCRQHGVPFSMFFYREKDESPAETRFADELFDQVSKVGQEYGFLVTDIRPWWGRVDRRSVTNSVVDWHPNARGHEILAKGMAKALISQGALSTSTSSGALRTPDVTGRRGG